MVGANQNVNGSRGWFDIRGLALTTISLSTKFEVTISTLHVDMIGDTKCRKWDGLGS